MNISSVIVHVKDENLIDEILNSLRKMSQCEVVAYENLKIVALISVENFEDELETFKAMERINGVAGVAMVYSYQEDLEGDLQRLKESGKLSEVLTNDDMQARDIVYSGSVHHKVK
ncbi:chaperone NapD [Campylobacter sp. RM16187]|uniref:chaperone NapD n=1 Tax=Campylobacter sp. RM16187 TaxID=1660063 RepID=UPI0021B621CC|nr:chaperone NapD [Campylobacter sp. RM16187]QKG29762.1 periplasmic nitrate reductase assembly protein [Campylobacter sp. RM16187]